MTSKQEPQPRHRHTWLYLQTQGGPLSSLSGQRAMTLLLPSLGGAAPVPEACMAKPSIAVSRLESSSGPYYPTE